MRKLEINNTETLKIEKEETINKIKLIEDEKVKGAILRGKVEDFYLNERANKFFFLVEKRKDHKTNK